MTPELKEQLLLRKFSSFEYFEEFSKHYFNFIDAAIEAVETYKASPPNPEETDTKIVDSYNNEIVLWESKVIPNFRSMYNGMITDIESAKIGNTIGIRSAAGDLRGLGKSMDGIRENFMDAIDPSIKEKYFYNLDQANTKGDNIYRTLSGYWRPGAIHDESITGPIEEQELLNYLRDGESVS